MKTVVLGPRPAELEALIERRRARGLDLYDEVWEGTYHISPAPHPFHGFVDKTLGILLAPYAEAAGLVGTGPFNLGTQDDYRVPDAGYHRQLPRQAFVPTAPIVVEVVSPDDETYEKFGFYARRGVEELLIADPAQRRVRCWLLRAGSYTETGRSELLAIDADDLTGRIDWP